MTIEAQKLEIIDWVTNLKDLSLLEQLRQIRGRVVLETEIKRTKRQAGWGKGLFTSMADDFNETPEGFEDYMH